MVYTYVYLFIKHIWQRDLLKLNNSCGFCKILDPRSNRTPYMAYPNPGYNLTDHGSQSPIMWQTTSCLQTFSMHPRCINLCLSKDLSPNSQVYVDDLCSWWFTYEWKKDQESCSKFHSPSACHLCYVDSMHIFSQGCWASTRTPKSSQYTTETFQTNSSADNSWGWRLWIN